MTAVPPAGFDSRFTHLRHADAPPGPKQIALVPGADVPVLSLDLPQGLRGQSREQVARRQLLDRAGLDGDRTQMRPIHPPREGDSWSRVLVADTALLADWKTMAGSACRALLPDYLALPTADGIWTVQALDEDLLVRMGPDDGFSAQSDVAVLMMQAQLAGAGTPPKAALVQGPVPDAVTDLLTQHDIATLTSPLEASALGLSEPRVLSHGELAFDLRRDPQLARARLRRQVLPWRWPVLLGLAALALWAAGQWVDTQRLNARTETITTQTRALVREHFVPSGPLLDMRIQVSQALAERRISATEWRSEVTALDLLATASGILSTTGAVPETISTLSVQELALTLKVADFAAVDDLAAQLRRAGLGVNVVESRVTEGSSDVRTEIRLTPAQEDGTND